MSTGLEHHLPSSFSDDIIFALATRGGNYLGEYLLINGHLAIWLLNTG
jgi:hypothetical protein